MIENPFMKKFLLTAVFASIVLLSAGQLAVTIQWHPLVSQHPADTLYYQKNYILRWSDFQGEAVPGTGHAALTSSGFGFTASVNYTEQEGNLKVKVYCYFLPAYSWYLASSKNDYILSHEQLHFDISYIGACYYIKNIQQASFTVNNYSALLRKLYAESYAQMNAMQDQYDKETNNGLDKGKQAAWAARIKKELATL